MVMETSKGKSADKGGAQGGRATVLRPAPLQLCPARRLPVSTQDPRLPLSGSSSRALHLLPLLHSAHSPHRPLSQATWACHCAIGNPAPAPAPGSHLRSPPPGRWRSHGPSGSRPSCSPHREAQPRGHSLLWPCRDTGRMEASGPQQRPADQAGLGVDRAAKAMLGDLKAASMAQGTQGLLLEDLGGF